MFSHLAVRVTRSRHCLRHLNFEVIERSELSCLLLSGHNILCVSAVPLVSSRRCAMSCFAVSLYQTKARSLFSRCHHSPDDVTWWHTATRHVPVANYISSIQKSNSATRFSHGAFSGKTQDKLHKNPNAYCQKKMTTPTVQTTL